VLKSNYDPLSRPFDEVFERWESRYRGAPLRVNFREVVGANSGVERFTHLIHPYPAKLLFNIPLFFLNCSQLGKSREVVCDPFCGSGTVLLEGLVSGRRVIGYDSNPLARLIAHVKTTAISPSSLEEQLKRVLSGVPRRGEGVPEGAIELERWFSASVTRQLDRLATGLRRSQASSEKSFLEACFSATILRVSLSDPTISVPVMLTPSKKSLSKEQQKIRRRWLRERMDADVFAEFSRIVTANIARMAKLHDHLSITESSVIGEDARAITGPIDLVITSPPYGSAQKYIRASGLPLQWLGLAAKGLRPLERATIGREHFDHSEMKTEAPIVAPSSAATLRSIGKKDLLRKHIAATFLAEMYQSLSSIAKALRPGGHLVLIVGNSFVSGSVFRIDNYLTEMCEVLGLRVRLKLVDRIRSRGLLMKRNGAPSFIADECILVFQKPES
jgi:DNA modification methylase